VGDVEQFEMHRVARRFLNEITKIAPGINIERQYELGPAG
jgi:hypothetical protein